MTTDIADAVYYDPYDFDIDRDPYPVWRRMREEVPLYRNERHDFYAVSRFDDVERCLLDPTRLRSGRGSVLEVLKLGVEQPRPGFILFEDAPIHTVHRSILSRVFTPKRMQAIEPEIRAFCAETLDPLRGAGSFDFIRDLGAHMPMRTIGMLLGIPRQDQEVLRDLIDDALRLDDPDAPPGAADEVDVIGGAPFARYVDQRIAHPTDDVMSELVHTEFVDETGTRRTLRRDEVLGYIGLVASAGNETTTRLIGWTGKLLADHPDQRKQIVDDPSLARRAIEEILRFEAPSPVQARYVEVDVELQGEIVPAGSALLLLNGAANRDDRRFPDGDRFDIGRPVDHHLTFGYGAHFCLGAALARLEGRIALEEVLARWPSWDVDWDRARQAHTSTVRGWERMPVVTS